MRSDKDELGFTHTRYQLNYNNIPVHSMQLVAHAQNGKLVSLNGSLNGIEKPIKEDKAILLKNKNISQIENKIELFNNNIKLIKNSNINFNERGWALKVSQLTGFTPSYSLKWIKKHLPEFANNCWQHSDNKNIIN